MRVHLSLVFILGLVFLYSTKTFSCGGTSVQVIDTAGLTKGGHKSNMNAQPVHAIDQMLLELKKLAGY